MAGLVFCKGICTFISGNSGMRFYFIKEDVGFRFSDRIGLRGVLGCGGGVSLGTTTVS